ncbi:unnamed protein product [Candidula unifasciata]|uniref:DZF domain-containing protein n=1 Tax=Candidula unifasciata TaxID=100452 RepID=A0A8S3ZUW1_9EUPU|nr:unnamed protein product [Candidula unifasciata]
MAHFVYPTANAMAQLSSPAQAYPTAQSPYVAAAPQTAYATSAAPSRVGQTYKAYPAAAASAVHAPTQYAYSRPQVTVTTAFPLQPTVSYDQSKAYYQPATGTTYTVAAEPQFQTAKSVFSSGATYVSQQRPGVVVSNAQAVPVSSAATSYVYSSAAPTITTYSTSNFTTTTPQNNMTGFDAAMYSSANLYGQQAVAKSGPPAWIVKKPVVGSQFRARPKGPPKAPQLYYCDVCKISCACPQTYRAHLEGQKHKKKEAAMKKRRPKGRHAQHQLKCKLCDVNCTGHDAYAAHIRGAKHQKVLTLHTKLGKPIPSTDPVLPAASKAASKRKRAAAVAALAKAVMVSATAKINFLGGDQLKSVGGKVAEKTEVTASSDISTVNSSTENAVTMSDEEGDAAFDQDVAPVGHEYIEQIKNELGKVISFNCKLCDCTFNDLNAEEMHLKGRRHRLQYKKKVDPSLPVNVKPNLRGRKIQEEKLRRKAQKEEKLRRKAQKEEYWRHRAQLRLAVEMRMEDQIYWGHRRMEMFGPLYPGFTDWSPMRPMGPMLHPPYPLPPGPPLPLIPRPESFDDRHVMMKHHSIYPTEIELEAVQNIVSSCERALKLVSDYLTESNKTEENPTPNRTLKGVMRVGVLAKGLLLHGDLNVNLVALCSEKPTRTLLEQVAEALPKQLATVTGEQFEIRTCVEESAIIVSIDVEPAVTCIVTLTSPLMREAKVSEAETVDLQDPPDVLDRQKCLDALAALRHAKWFQARANGLQSCVIIIRVLRELCQRVPAWAPLNEWAMELLVEKCISTSAANITSGEALRRVFECIASGILLPGGPGLYDPCEKEPYDAAATMTNQQREDITTLAQHALRQVAFRHIHKVLGIDLLPDTKFPAKLFFNRKRRQSNSTGDEGAKKKYRKEKAAELPVKAS